jgi:hypothetical protein
MSSIVECLLLSYMDFDTLMQHQTGEWDVQNPAAKQRRGAAHSDVTCCGRDAHPYKEPLKERKNREPGQRLAGKAGTAL